MKRILSLVLALCTVFTFCTSTSLVVSAADEYYMDYDAWVEAWDYEDGIIYGYYGEDKDVIIPSMAPDGTRITEVYSQAFLGNKIIENVVVSEGIEMIHGECFADCVNLKSITLPSTLTSFSWGNNFRNCTSLKSLTIPGGISEIPVGFASGCTALEEVIFTPGGNDIVIRLSAFNGTGLDRIVLPNNVVEIHAKSFFNTKSQSGTKFEMYITNPNVKLGGGKDNHGAETDPASILGIAPGYESVKAVVYVDSKATNAIKFFNTYVSEPPYVSPTKKSTAFFESLPEMKEVGIPETAADEDAIYEQFFKGELKKDEVKEEVIVEENDNGGFNLDTKTLIIILGAAFLFVILIIVGAIVFVVMKNKKAAKAMPPYPYPYPYPQQPQPPVAPDAPQAPTEQAPETKE